MSITALAKTYVENNDAIAFRDLLADIEVSNLTDEEMEVLLRAFLTPCELYRKKWYCRDVISRFDYDEYLPILTKLFTFRQLEDKIISFVIETHPEVKAMEHIDNLNEYKDDENMNYAFQRIITLYPELITQEYIQLYNLAIDNKNKAMIEILKNEVVKKNVLAPIPTWVIPLPEGRSLEVPEPPEFKFEMPSDRVAVKRLQKAFGRLKITGPDEGFKKSYAKKTAEEKEALMRDVHEQERTEALEKMTEYNKLIGPRNPEEDGWYEDKEHPCYKYGGHAMFLCTCNEQRTEDAEDFAIDWYLGYCIRCNRRFKSRVHVIRRVRLTGGWIGCFCVDCINDPSIPFEEDREEYDIEETNRYIGILERDKVYDRPEGLILPLPEYDTVEQDEDDKDITFTFEDGGDQGFEVIELRKGIEVGE